MWRPSGIDETSRRGRNCITVVADLVEHDVINVTPGKDPATVERFSRDFMDHNGVPEYVRLVACDMSLGFRKGIREHLPHARRIVDRFHVARHANEAVDKAGKTEGRSNPLLKRTKYLWLRNEESLTELQVETKRNLTRQRLKTGRACRMREVLQDIYTDSRTPSEAWVRLHRLSTHTMMANATVSSYLANLMELGIVEREFPVTAKPKERAKGSRGLYQLNDNFFRFWYSFVFPYRSELERGDVEGVYERHIKPVLHDFAGKPFEGLCREWMWRESAAGRLPFRARAVGRWWDRQDEIDVMAVDNASDAAIVGECKFRNAPVDRSVLNLLRDRAARTGIGQRTYLLFSLGGFDQSLVDDAAASQSDVQLVGIDELFHE